MASAPANYDAIEVWCDTILTGRDVTIIRRAHAAATSNVLAVCEVELFTPTRESLTQEHIT